MLPIFKKKKKRSKRKLLSSKLRSHLQTLFHTLTETCIKPHYSVVFRGREHLSAFESGAGRSLQFQNVYIDSENHVRKDPSFTGGETWLPRNLFFQVDGIN